MTTKTALIVAIVSLAGLTWLGHAPLAQAARDLLETSDQRLARLSTDRRMLRQAIRDQFSAAEQQRQRVVAATRMGSWQSDGYQRPLQSWTVQAERDRVDGTLHGRLMVVGSGSLSDAQISGKVDGSSVAGIIVGSDGLQVGTFTGSVYRRGMAGTYATVDGESGKWSYEDPEAETATAELAKTVASGDIEAIENGGQQTAN